MARKCVQITPEIMATTERIYADKNKFCGILHNKRNMVPFNPNETQNVYGLDYWDLLSIPQIVAYNYNLIYFSPNGNCFCKGIFRNDDTNFDGRLILVPRSNIELSKKCNIDIPVDILLRINIRRFFPNYSTYDIRYDSDGDFVELIPYCDTQCYFCGSAIFAGGYKYFNRHICNECAEEIWEGVEESHKRNT